MAEVDDNPQNLNILPTGTEAADDLIAIYDRSRGQLYSIQYSRLASPGGTAEYPAGGDTGDILAKASPTDSDVEWVTPTPPTTDAGDLTTGTLPDGRFPATLPAVSGANLTDLDASQLTTGVLPDEVFPAILPAVSAANLTDLPANSFDALEDGVVIGTDITGFNFVGADVTVALGVASIQGRSAYQGAWSGATAYDPGQTVTHNGQYFLQIDSVASTNDNPDTETTVWALLAAKGDDALTTTNAADLTSGTLANARLSGAYTGVTGLGTQASALNMADQELQRPYLVDIAEKVNAIGSATGTVDVDMTLGNIATATLTGNTTWTFSNPPATGRAGTLTLIVTGNGTATMTFPGGIDWGTLGAPATLANNEVIIITVVTLNAGTKWRGTWADGYT